jgi:hypothetical protein
VKATETAGAFTILGGLDDEAEVSRDALVSLSGVAGGVLRLVGLVEFGLDTDWTGVDFGGNRQLGYSSSVAVHVADAAGMKMPETLVPEDTESLASQMVDLPSVIFF